ncbi:hypothetical protein [Psychroserpens algicola]|uniref:hypothetical protein n=1 Tax=Psychroserpens algicola TaxID=1719034 RepID=UPI0019540BAB|nr:hypothetical protein [Psychroserpens algicola]
MLKNDKDLGEFLSNKPIYSKIKLESGFSSANKFDKSTFQYFCEIDESIETFELIVYHGYMPFRDHLNTGGQKHWKNKDDFFSLTQQYKGICKRCNKYHIDFLLNTYADEEGLHLRKVGQYPPFEITPEKYLLNYFIKEDKENYKKALLLLSQSFGIGAFSYLRRIVENEIIRIIEDLSNLDFPESNQIKDLLETYSKNHQMANLIEGINDYLPNTLKSIGNNPIKVLYSQLSGGIHSFSEDECLEKAQLIDTLLKFVIRKINEENSEIKIAREAMNKLSEK